MIFRTRSAAPGFALPTVVIASVVMFAVLVAVSGVVSSSRVSLDVQYYEALANDAAESGAEFASACLGDNTMVLNTVVKPNMNCAGSPIAGQSAYVTATTNYRTSYTAQLTSVTATTRTVKVTGLTERLRSSNASVFSTNTVARTLSSSLVVDPNGDRPSKRFWLFGKQAVLDFGVSGNAMPTPSISTSSPAWFANAGTTVVTDQSGNLQFSSNGLTIWDKAGNVMQNSSGLSGGSSATLAMSSFPLNSARTKYAVISNTGQAETGPGELYLSIVDLTLNSGYGAVTTKNQKLGTGTGYTNEAFGAMPNNDGSGYYVYTFHASNATITRFLVKQDGSVTGPVTIPMSPAPQVCNTLISSGITGYGTFNFSKDFKRMVIMVGSYGCANDASGTVYVYDTNSSTGNLSLYSSWTAHGKSGSSSRGYSADFSPQEGYVYITNLYPGNFGRYSLQDPANVAASEWIIGSNTTNTTAGPIYDAGGQIRRGPDGRMYMADRGEYNKMQNSGSTVCRISYINTPDAPTNSTAAIGLNLDGLTLTTNSCSVFGLPQMATVFKPRVLLY